MEDSDNIDLMSPSDALEVVLELAQAQAERTRQQTTAREAERLSVQAALEQLDHLLHEHWDSLDNLPRDADQQTSALRRVESPCIWWVRGSVPVEQSPSESIRIAVELAEKARPVDQAAVQSADEALSWTRQFLSRYGVTLDKEFGQAE